MTNLLFEPRFGKLRGNVRTSTIASWKARGGLPIRDNWTFFRYLLRSTRYKQILVEVGAFQRGWVTLSANFRWKGMSPPTIVGIRKLECFCYLTVKSAWSYLHSSGESENGRTDGRTELLWLIQRSSLQTMRPHCKNLHRNSLFFYLM